ncbi:hypothetical protein D6856_09880 [Butyrivibrio sp. XB500-5]|uniref:hypothetical protein n=1 Tax=Butyrivibrio sp. XB500-5 TaxID=2364880 RepID=UPI000EA8B7CD|nr:hypothetical protein [Butyrivibrio sp. XB500-5]RKM59517.1 hypothetical protein D6856_09880 [Butyrivibrio sp. XB500-5]
MIFELDYSNQEKEILEGKRRYREQMNSMYTAGYTDAEEKCLAKLAEKNAAIAKLDAEIAEKKTSIAKIKTDLEKKIKK